MRKALIIFLGVVAGLVCLGGSWWLGFQRGVDEAVRLSGSLDWEGHLRTGEIALSLAAGDEPRADMRRREVLVAVLHDLGEAAPNAAGQCNESQRQLLRQAAAVLKDYPRKDQLARGFAFCEMIAANEQRWFGGLAARRAAARAAAQSP